MHPMTEPRLVHAHVGELRRRAHVQRSRPVGAPRAPHAGRVALGQLLVRLGQRLSGASPGHA